VRQPVYVITPLDIKKMFCRKERRCSEYVQAPRVHSQVLDIIVKSRGFTYVNGIMTEDIDVELDTSNSEIIRNNLST
jgi:hypothetical protein